jgi:mRNA interferase RelE/StbE
MPWRVITARLAERDLTRMSERDRRMVLQRLEMLSDAIDTLDKRKLSGQDDTWRLRVGRWRVLLDVDNRAGTIVVLRVLPRDRAYR